MVEDYGLEEGNLNAILIIGLIDNCTGTGEVEKLQVLESTYIK